MEFLNPGTQEVGCLEAGSVGGGALGAPGHHHPVEVEAGGDGEHHGGRVQGGLHGQHLPGRRGPQVHI